MVDARGSLLAVLVALGVAGCTGSSSPPRPDEDEGVRLSVRTVSGQEGMSSSERAAAESAVGEVVSRYLSAAFLREHPRTDFVRALDVFTPGAAALAARDLDLLTASGVEDLQRVTPTALAVRLSWYVVEGRPLAATARVRFDLEGDTAGSTSTDLSLDGRLLLRRDDDSWAVFGYDVRGTS